MELFVVGMNHRTSSVHFREQLALSDTNIPRALKLLVTDIGLHEVVIVSTCNRVEVYGVGLPEWWKVRAIFEALSACNHSGVELDWDEIEENVFLHRNEECIRHLFRMVSSLDSLVVGETEIVGQVKRAYELAQKKGATGPCLNRLFQSSFNVSKTVRIRSGIGRYSVSVGSIAADLALQLIGDEREIRTVLMIGAGKMTETALQHLKGSAPVSVFVANRSLARAEELANQFQGHPLSMEAVPAALVRADIVISSTSAPHHVIRKLDVAHAQHLRGDRGGQSPRPLSRRGGTTVGPSGPDRPPSRDCGIPPRGCTKP